MAVLEERTIPSPVSRVIGDLDFVFRIFVTRKDDPVVKRRESSRRKAEGPLPSLSVEYQVLGPALARILPLCPSGW